MLRDRSLPVDHCEIVMFSGKHCIKIKNHKKIIFVKSGVVAMSDFFDLPSLNIIWGLINSSRFEYTDQKLKAGRCNNLYNKALPSHIDMYVCMYVFVSFRWPNGCTQIFAWRVKRNFAYSPFKIEGWRILLILFTMFFLK